MNLGGTGSTRRDTLTGWKRYMEQNPLYFRAVFGERASIEDEGRKLFGIHKRMSQAAVKHRRKPRPTLTGIMMIGRFIGLSKDMVHRYIRRGMPTFFENRQRCAYEGRVSRWARRHKIGRFA